MTDSHRIQNVEKREDDGGGFLISSPFTQHNYDHDADALKLSAADVYHSIKKLPKLQKDIKRKSGKRESKDLVKNKGDYNVCLTTVLDSLERIKKILSGKREDNAGRSRRSGQCHAFFQKDSDQMLLHPKNDSLQTEYDRERPERGLATVLKEHNYDHAVGTLELSAADVYLSIKRLPELQKDIKRKSKKEKSKYLRIKKGDYDSCLATALKGLKRIKEILSAERDDNTDRGPRAGTSHACFQEDRDLMISQAQKDCLQTEYESALTSSKLRDNNPNLTDLNDAIRPTKISEMFTELYDNEWTDAFDELSRTNREAVTIQQLNKLLTDAYDCCMRLSHPIRLFLDTKSTKFQIDSEFRQKVIGHIKRNATAVISDLKKDLESEILKRCMVHDQNPRLLDYINKSIEICWLMAVQDPPMYLYNVQTAQFDSSKFREYQRGGFYTEYIVWPALALSKNGLLLSKGVAQGCDKLYVRNVPTVDKFKSTGRSEGEEITGEKKLTKTWYISANNSHGPTHVNRQPQSYGNRPGRYISTDV